MSELVLKWLNQDIGLSRKVCAFETDFANGYLFGEVLHKHGLLDHFEDRFINENTVYAKERNFAMLTEAFKGPASDLQITLRKSQMDEIMSEDRGSSLRLLYQLRKGLDKVGVGVNRVVGSTALKRDVKTRMVRKTQGEEAEHFYESQMIPLGKGDPRRAHQLHAKPFADAHTKLLQRAGDMEERDRQTRKNQEDSHRDSQLSVMRRRKEERNEATRLGEERWQETALRKMDHAEGELNFKKSMIRKVNDKKRRELDFHRRDCGYARDNETDGIGWFEKNLARIGVDTSEHAGSLQATIKAANMGELYEQLEDKMPSTIKTSIEASKHMNKIKEAKKATDQARKERDRRQNRLQLDQAAAQPLAEEQQRMEGLLVQLETEAADCRRDALAWDLAQRRGDAARRQRDAEQRRNAQNRARDLEEAIERLAERAKEEHCVREAAAAAARARAETHEDSSGEEDGGEPLGARGTTPRPHLATPRTPKRDASTGESIDTIPPVGELMTYVQDSTVLDFIFGRGAWESFRLSEEEAKRLTDGNSKPRLGRLLRWLQSEPMTSATAPQLPTDFLPIVFVEWATAGLGDVAMAVARRLCTEMEFALVEPQAVAQECMELVSKDDQEPDHPVLARMHQLGHSLLERPRVGNAIVVPRLTYAELIFRKIELLSAPPAVAEEDKAPPDPKKKARGKDKKAEEEPKPLVRPKGIVVFGLPPHMLDIAAWESALQGYLSPLLRIFDSDTDLQAHLSSLLAPWWAEYGAVPEVFHAQHVEVLNVHGARYLQLRHPDHQALVNAVASEAADAGSWVPLQNSDRQGAPTEVEGIPAAACEGYGQEFSLLVNPVDRAWLHMNSQSLTQTFLYPLQCLETIMAETSEQNEGGAGESLIEVCCRQALRLMATWRKPDHAMCEQAQSDEVKAEGDDGGEMIEPTEEDDAVEIGGGQREGCDATVPNHGVAETWRFLDSKMKMKLQGFWVNGIAAYLTGLRSGLAELRAFAPAYAQGLADMQGAFLAFLHQKDEREHVLLEFLQRWAPRHSNGPAADDISPPEIDDLSDRLWQFADRHRGHSVEELARWRSSGFWEDQAYKCLRLLEKLALLEHERFCVSSALLVCAYTGMEAPLSQSTTKNIEAPEGLSSLGDLLAWAEACTGNFVNYSAHMDDENDDLEVRAQPRQELQSAISAEKAGQVRRLNALRCWTTQLLIDMRKQLDEAFARMDDWIRDRVAAENSAIKAVVSHILGVGPLSAIGTAELCAEEPPQAGRSPEGRRTSKGRKSGRLSTGSASDADRRRWREVRALLEPKPLDANVFRPPDRPFPVSAASVAPARWTPEMLQSLMSGLVARGRCASSLSADQVFEELLQRRGASLQFREALFPSRWCGRSEASLAALCRGFEVPSWGAVAVDLTEFLLTLSLHELQIHWPSRDSLLSTRRALEAEGGDIIPSDKSINWSTFARLPLLDEQISQDVQKLVFEILSFFEGDAVEDDPMTRSVSVSRLFTYMGLGVTPVDGLKRLLDALHGPQRQAEDTDAGGAASELRVATLWGILFSCHGRPANAVTPAPSLAEFCEALFSETVEAAAERPASSAKKGGKAVRAPEAIAMEGVHTQLPPEEATIALNESLLRRPAVVRALCTHGALLCRKRVLADLFPTEGDVCDLLHSGTQVGQTHGLDSLVPTQKPA